MRTALVAFVLALLAPIVPAGRARAEDARHPESYVGVSLMGFAGFLRLDIGSFELSYERVLASHHGIQIAGDFIHVHEDAAHQSIHLWTFGGSATYRYYFEPGEGLFLGVNVGYRRGFGREGGHHEGEATQLEIEQIRALGQVGYRFFVPEVLLTVVPRAAVGYGEYHVRATTGDDAASRASALLARDVLAPWALVVELELTVGIGF